MRYLDPERLGSSLRSRCIDSTRRAVRLARLSSGSQTSDTYHSWNCAGFGRARRFEHFKLFLGAGRTDYKQRILFRGPPREVPFFAQSFQLAACDIRCWYCFVDDKRLSADSLESDFIECSRIVDLFLSEPDQLDIIDLSGGQPDVIPEWSLWILQELESRGYRGRLHVWIDDNLVSENFWKVLREDEIEYVCSFPNTSRAGCFKGFSPESFSFNTRCDPRLFDLQFQNFGRFIQAGVDMYAYATFTARHDADLQGSIERFLDRLQAIHRELPLRVLPLKVFPFTATTQRMEQVHQASLVYQYTVFEEWLLQLGKRFSAREREQEYADIRLN